MGKLKLEAQSGALTARPKAPTLGLAIETYKQRLPGSGKTSKTQRTERGYLSTWERELGSMPIGKLRANHVRGVLDTYSETHAARSTNLLLIALRNVLSDVVQDGFLGAIPTDIESIKWRKIEHHSRRLIHGKEIDDLCAKALTATKNGQQLSDYLKFLRFTGAREQEALWLKWDHVNFAMGIVTLGSEGGTKSRKPRHVDMNPDLRAHLEEMSGRRDPGSQWVFPSPQRGERDIHARSLRESLRLTCAAANIRIGFHDLRHFFVSHAVMAGIDFMTIARWVGHADGGVLIGKVYGHLASGHTKRMAQQLSLSTVQ
jgi:integrase